MRVVISKPIYDIYLNEVNGHAWLAEDPALHGYVYNCTGKHNYVPVVYYLFGFVGAVHWACQCQPLVFYLYTPAVDSQHFMGPYIHAAQPDLLSGGTMDEFRISLLFSNNSRVFGYCFYFIRTKITKNTRHVWPSWKLQNSLLLSVSSLSIFRCQSRLQTRTYTMIIYSHLLHLTRAKKIRKERITWIWRCKVVDFFLVSFKILIKLYLKKVIAPCIWSR